MDDAEKDPVTLDYAPRVARSIVVNWNYVVLSSIAATALTWFGYAWAALRPTDFPTVSGGLITSTVGWLVGGLLLFLALASFIVRVSRPGRRRLGVVVLLTVSQQIGCYMTDVLFGQF